MEKKKAVRNQKERDEKEEKKQGEQKTGFREDMDFKRLLGCGG